jgi:hypothetical protein
MITKLALMNTVSLEIRNACCAAKVKFNKKEKNQQVSIDIETYSILTGAGGAVAI